jgi:hypothetical protein
LLGSSVLDRAHVGIGRIDINGSLAADRLGQPARGDAAALGIVGADVGDREFDRAVRVVAVATVTIDDDDLDAGVYGSFERADHLVLIGRSGDDVIEVAARDHGIQKRRLGRNAPGRWNLGDDLDTEVFCRPFHAELHDLIERIDNPRQKANLEFLGGSGVTCYGRGEPAAIAKAKCLRMSFSSLK